MGHRHGRRPTGSGSAAEMGEREQMFGVLLRWYAFGDHLVVARALRLAAQPAARDPHQGIEPERGAQDFRRYLYKPVVARDVGELVPEHGTEARFRPVSRVGGKQDTRPERAGGGE